MANYVVLKAGLTNSFKIAKVWYGLAKQQNTIMSWSKGRSGHRRRQKTKRYSRCSRLGSPYMRQCSTGHQHVRNVNRQRRPIQGGFIQDFVDAARGTLDRGKQTWNYTTGYMQELGDGVSEKYRKAKGALRRYLAKTFRDEYAEGDIVEAYEFLENYGSYISPLLVAEIHNSEWFTHISKYLPVLADPKKCLESPITNCQEDEQQLLLAGEIRELFEFLNAILVVFTQIDWVQQYAPGFVVNAYLDIALRNKHSVILRFLEEQTIPLSAKCGKVSGYSLEMTFSDGTVYAVQLNLSQSSAQTEFRCTSTQHGISYSQVCLEGRDLRRIRGNGPSVLYGIVKAHVCVKWLGPSAKYSIKNGLRQIP